MPARQTASGSRRAAALGSGPVGGRPADRGPARRAGRPAGRRAAGPRPADRTAGGPGGPAARRRAEVQPVRTARLRHAEGRARVQGGEAGPGVGVGRVQDQGVPVRRRGLPGVAQRGGDRADRGVRARLRRRQLDRVRRRVPALPRAVGADQRPGQRGPGLPVPRRQPYGRLGRLDRETGPAEPAERGGGQPVTVRGLRLQPDQPVGGLQRLRGPVGGEQRHRERSQQVGPLQPGGERVGEHRGGLRGPTQPEERIRPPRGRQVPDHDPRG